MKDTVKKLRESLLPLYGPRETEAIIRLIFHYLKGWDLTAILIHGDDELSPFIKEEIDKILQRLLNYEPIQYITGEARFHGLELKVKPGVLIPRPETAELVDIIVDEADRREDLQVLDVGTGSGAIALALASSLRFPQIYALDISKDALEIARENAKNLNLKIQFIQADIFKWEPDGYFDIIVSNPPYIDLSERSSMERNVIDYEPEKALFVPDNDPICFYKRIADIGCRSLKTDGRIYFEINPRYAAEIKNLMIDKRFTDIEIVRDSFGKERFVKGIWKDKH